jgi:hypothetical protein
MNSTEVFAIIGLITSLGYLGLTMSSGRINKASSNITTGGKHTKRVHRSNRKTRK